MVVREKRATFSLAPGQPPRPGAETPVRGFFLAGDWTDTGLPSTIEGAVESGHRAAALLRPRLTGLHGPEALKHRKPEQHPARRFMKSVIVHYQELALKGRNRPWFVDRLKHNLKVATAGLDISRVRSLMGRIEIVLGPEARWEDVASRLETVCGVANYSRAGRTSSDLDALGAAIVADLGERTPRVIPRRGTTVGQAVSDPVAGDRAGRWAHASRPPGAGPST